MTNPTITIHNVETDELIEREMNAEELAQWETDKADQAAREEAEALKASDKAALLAKLGITDNEAKLLLS
jgi:hypothetical protein